MHPNPGNPGIEQPGQANAAAMVVGVGAFSGTLRGLKLIPSKRRCLVPPTSPHDPRQGAPRGLRDGYSAKTMQGWPQTVGRLTL